MYRSVFRSLVGSFCRLHHLGLAYLENEAEPGILPVLAFD